MNTSLFQIGLTFHRLVLFNLSDDAVLDMNHFMRTIGHSAFVGHHHDGHALFLIEVAQQLHHFRARLLVERTGGLIGQNYLGMSDDGAGNGHTLLLTAGEFAGQMVRPLLQA